MGLYLRSIIVSNYLPNLYYSQQILFNEYNNQIKMQMSFAWCTLNNSVTCLNRNNSDQKNILILCKCNILNDGINKLKFRLTLNNQAVCILYWSKLDYWAWVCSHHFKYYVRTESWQEIIMRSIFIHQLEKIFFKLSY